MFEIRTRLLLTALIASASVALPACGGDEEEPDVAVEEPMREPAAEAPTGAAQQPVAAADLPPGVTQEMVQQGREVYSGPGNCYTCHGPNATGTQLAPDLTDSDWLWIPTDQPADQTFEALVQNVRTGITQPKEHPAPMPPMGGGNLSDEQVRAVAAYVYSLGGGLPAGGGE